MNRESRQMAEVCVMRKVGGNIFDAGLSIRVCCEGDDESVGETDMHTACTDEFIKDSTCADMIHWLVFAAGGNGCGSVLLVLGNDGYDVIADHSRSMTPFMPTDSEMRLFQTIANAVSTKIPRVNYRSMSNPAPETAQEIHDTLVNADYSIETETDNFAAIADLAIEGLAARKTISEAVAMLESFELNDDFHDSLEAIIDVLKREVSP